MVDTLEGLDETLKPMYKEVDGKFQLSVDGLPKQDETLATRIQKLETNNQALLTEKIEAKKEAERVKLEAAKAGGDVEAIEKSWQEKFDNGMAEKETKIADLGKMVSGLTVGSSSVEISAEIFGENAELMKHHVDSRLSVDMADGTAKIRVLGADGKPSALTLAELKAELVNNEKFAPFVVGTKASGGGGGDLKKGNPAAKTINRAAFNALNPTDQMAHVKAKGEVVD